MIRVPSVECRVPGTPRARRLDVVFDRRGHRGLYLLRLNCGHMVFDRLKPEFAVAVLFGTVLECHSCLRGLDV